MTGEEQLLGSIFSGVGFFKGLRLIVTLREIGKLLHETMVYL